MDKQAKSLLVFGEVLFDLINDQVHLGGASLNVAAHFAKHGNEAYLISAVGDDSLGKQAKFIANSYGINTELIHVNDHPTGIVEVTLSALGQPSYNIVEQVAWDFIELSDEDLSKLQDKHWDCFYFGMLAQRSALNKITLKRLFEIVQFSSIFFDVNLRDNYFTKEGLIESMQYCTILKLNDEEVDVLSTLLFNTTLSCEGFAECCAMEFSIDIILVTLGANGAGFYANGSYSTVPGVRVKVADTVGAGDSFSAAFLSAYLNGESLRDAVEAGCKMGAYVASKHGAVPDYKNRPSE